MEVDGGLTKLLLKNSNPGNDEYVVMSGPSSRLYTRFNPPMEFTPTNEDYEIALCRLETCYSFPNIDETNNVFRISINNGVDWLDLKIPLGSYSLADINETLQRLLRKGTMSNDGREKKDPYVVLTGNRNTFKCELEIMKKSTIVDFNTQNSIRSILGFSAKKYHGGERYESENKVNILRVKSILVQCDVIKPSRVNGIPLPVIYNFFPNASPAGMIIVQPEHLNYMSLTLNVISSMTALVTDQEGAILDLRGEQLTLTFHIRKRR